MSRFNDYSKYYDLLYKDKDYTNEVKYINNLLTTHCENVHNILDLGCGTGKHALLLASEGYEVTGVDLSTQMIKIAQENQTANVNFFHGDVRNYRTDTIFDAVISLFHVMSYQVTNDDIKNALKTAYHHLKADGTFIFDCWYGPAVLTDKPVCRVKNFQNEYLRIVRIAEPVIFPNENYVEVNYHLFIKDLVGKQDFEIIEQHNMRYLFFLEILELASSVGFSVQKAYKWMTFDNPDASSWNVVFILKK